MTAEPSTGDVEIGLQTVSESDPPVPGSNASTMSTVSSCTERDSNDSSEPGVDEHSMKEYELVRSVLYSTRDNVNIVLEVFRQVRETCMLLGTTECIWMCVCVHKRMCFFSSGLSGKTRRPASADRTARAANFRRYL